MKKGERIHCQNYKAGALTGIDGDNRRLHKYHKSNPDIDNERSVNNVVYAAPKKNLEILSLTFIKNKRKMHYLHENISSLNG